MKNKFYIFLLALVALSSWGLSGIVTSLSFASTMESEIDKQCEIHKNALIKEGYDKGFLVGNGRFGAEYNMGFNDALDHIILVNLEFTQLKNNPKTMGELAAICRERRGIYSTETTGDDPNE